LPDQESRRESSPQLESRSHAQASRFSPMNGIGVYNK
jgi:hypothetical protein